MPHDPLPANQMNGVRRAAYEALSRDSAPWCTPLFREVVQVVLTFADLRVYDEEDGGRSYQWDFNMGPAEVANLIGREVVSKAGHKNGMRGDIRRVLEALCEIGMLRLTFRARGPLPASYQVFPSRDIRWADAAEFLAQVRRRKRSTGDAQASPVGDAQAQGDAQASPSGIDQQLGDAQASPRGRSGVPSGDAQASPPLPYRDQGEEMAEVVEEPSPQDARAPEAIPGVDRYAERLEYEQLAAKNLAELRHWFRGHSASCDACMLDDPARRCPAGGMAYERLSAAGLPFTPHLLPPARRSSDTRGTVGA